MQIKEGDYVLGAHGRRVPYSPRATGDPQNRLQGCFTLGSRPCYSREQQVKDVIAYHMIGFSVCHHIKRTCSGAGLPFTRFCMFNTGLVNMLPAWALRIEDIHLLAAGRP